MHEITAAHLRLGQELRQVRKSRGVNTRSIPKRHSPPEYFSSGHISLVENGRTPPSPELIDAYVELAADGTRIRALYEQMLAASAAAGRQRRGALDTEGSVAPQTLADIASREDVQRHYVVEMNRADYLFGPTGAIRQVDCAVALRAKTPGVKLYCTGHSYPADPRPGVLNVSMVTGARLEAVRESRTGALQSFFVLSEALEPSDPEPHTVEFRLTVQSPVRSAPHLRYHAEAGNQQMVLHTRFQAPSLPSHIWNFGVPNVLDAEHPQTGTEFGQDRSGSYSHIFEPLVPGWCYGFGWTW